ncbi:hypothetical protein [Streptomyces sp. NPDC056600]|uniref:hypothetical protein n=1 Tax=Streptomyces sp. NPDC056600 TaxID=3345874 RepID=UPI0036C58FFD
MKSEVGGELFAVCGGLAATAVGLVLATDLRGAARVFLRLAASPAARRRWPVANQRWAGRPSASNPGRARRPSAAGPVPTPRPLAASLGRVRMVAGLVALAGAVALVLGVLVLLRNDPHAVLTERPLPMPPLFAAVFPLMAVGTLWRYWRGSGLLREIWATGTRVQRGATVAFSVCLVLFMTFLGTGRLNLVFCAWTAAAATVVTVLVGGRTEEARQGTSVL